MNSKKDCRYCGCKTIQDRTWLEINGVNRPIWKCRCCGYESARIARRPKVNPELDALFAELTGETK